MPDVVQHRCKPDRSLESLARVRDQTLERRQGSCGSLGSVVGHSTGVGVKYLRNAAAGRMHRAQAMDIAVVRGVWKRVFPKTKLFDMPQTLKIPRV